MGHQHETVSGLPGSSTTLLSAILNQNPKFQASISGPLASFTRAFICTGHSEETKNKIRIAVNLPITKENAKATFMSKYDSNE